MDRRRCAALLTALLGVVLIVPAAGQVAGRQSAPQPAPVTEVDPLGRNTPRGTITGFTSAVHREDFVEAEAYLQLTERQRPNAETLARTLTALLDRYFTHPLGELSGSPAGVAGDGLPLDQERIVLEMSRGTADIVLRRVPSPQGGIWLISSETLAQVPSLGRSLEASWIDQHLPDTLVHRSFFGVSLAEWSVWGASIGGPLLLFWLATGQVVFVARRRLSEAARRTRLDVWVAGLRWLTVLVLTLLVHLALLPLLPFTLQFRLVYSRCVLVVAVVLLTMLAWRFTDLSARHARIVAQRKGSNAGRQSLFLLGERVFKVLLVLLSILLLLVLAGVHPTTALAGLGLGGVALALGAQKSVENLLGAVFLLTDGALAVGDFCCVADRQGWIEDITLRSVRLRTVEQTLVSIPAGVLSQGNIENFTTRHKVLIQSTLRLRYGTTAAQLQSIIDQIHTLVAGHPQLDAESARVRLVNFGPHAIELELFAYVLTSDYAHFMAVRESVLLAAAAIVESAGSSFARPTDFLYVSGATVERPQVTASS